MGAIEDFFKGVMIFFVIGIVISIVMVIIGNIPKHSDYQDNINMNDIIITFMPVEYDYKGKYSWDLDEGYKYAKIGFFAENIGSKSKSFPFYRFDAKLKVDKGYEYSADYSQSDVPIRLRPEDREWGVLVFEILDDTTPTELIISRTWGTHKITITEEDIKQ